MKKVSQRLMIVGNIIAFFGFILYRLDTNIVYVYTSLGISLLLMLIAIWSLIRS